MRINRLAVSFPILSSLSLTERILVSWVSIGESLERF